ncbi:DgyrCDS2406 [Dimorphilus gyrociliatus]|uniref:DgyrCDS2406 n=1 Tax=Dimorphilus gyrociliatus TaxID=2664684 RepID=A0A7I8VFB8_9ANNE|nr:DgyrCDS2406 [Dimorphilus gyrociliatus]
MMSYVVRKQLSHFPESQTLHEDYERKGCYNSNYISQPMVGYVSPANSDVSYDQPYQTKMHVLQTPSNNFPHSSSNGMPLNDYTRQISRRSLNDEKRDALRFPGQPPNGQLFYTPFNSFAGKREIFSQNDPQSRAENHPVRDEKKPIKKRKSASSPKKLSQPDISMRIILTNIHNLVLGDLPVSLRKTKPHVLYEVFGQLNSAIVEDGNQKLFSLKDGHYSIKCIEGILDSEHAPFYRGMWLRCIGSFNHGDKVLKIYAIRAATEDERSQITQNMVKIIRSVKLWTKKNQRNFNKKKALEKTILVAAIAKIVLQVNAVVQLLVNKNQDSLIAHLVLPKGVAAMVKHAVKNFPVKLSNAAKKTAVTLENVAAKPRLAVKQATAVNPENVNVLLAQLINVVAQ